MMIVIIIEKIAIIIIKAAWRNQSPEDGFKLDKKMTTVLLYAVIVVFNIIKIELTCKYSCTYTQID